MALNTEQQKIVEHLRGAVLVNAPMGTGKTTVLTERVAAALKSGITPDAILCLTFTNRAADEMRTRLSEKIASKVITDQLTVTTFHGFCAGFLRAESDALGVDHEFTVIDDDDQVALFENIVQENFPAFVFHEEKGKKDFYMKKIEQVYAYRLHVLQKQMGGKIELETIDATLLEIGAAYRSLLLARKLMDFEELVIMTLEGLLLDAGIQKRWRDKFQFIQLDEFQDTHLSEYLVIKELAKGHRNIALIGDLDQTIYGWRGSEPLKIREYFRHHFAPVEEFSLTTNYRSNPQLLAAIKSYLPILQNRTTEKLESSVTEAEAADKPIEMMVVTSQMEEYSHVADQIVQLRSMDPAARMAVLVRKNKTVSEMLPVFEQKNIAYVTIDSFDFFKRQEVKDALALLKIIANPFDMDSAKRLATRLKLGISQQSVKAIRDAQETGLRLADFFALERFGLSDPLEQIAALDKVERILVIDTETTGTDTSRDDVIQISACEIKNGVIQPHIWNRYCTTDAVLGSSGAVHGITSEFLQKEGRSPREVFQEFIEYCDGAVIVGHNIGFDIAILESHAQRLGMSVSFTTIYDTLDIARRFVAAENYKLATLVRVFSLPIATHDARDDVRATAHLLQKLGEKATEKAEERAAIWQAEKAKWIRMAHSVGEWKRKAKGVRPAETLTFVMENSGLNATYAAEPNRMKSLETLKEIATATDDIDLAPWQALKSFVQRTALSKGTHFLGLDSGKVPIVTVHQVKGLEFDYVFIPHCIDGEFPMWRREVTEKEAEEEKRLFYVALTRAKKKIYISASRFDSVGRSAALSPFAQVIDKRFVNSIEVQ